MTYLLIGLLVVVLAFAGVLLRGAPYLPTLRTQANTALDLLDLRPGQTLLELGSGDGKVLLLAAQRGLNVVGIELNPFLVAVSWLRTWRYRKQVRVIWGDMWNLRWPECDGVFTFLLDRFMPRLDKHMRRMQAERARSRKGRSAVRTVPLASVAFQIPGRNAEAERAGVFLYRY